ncbi:MAG TPA: Ig-like domain-containing protein, partial [Verrucomicrobiae bacterium]
FTNSATLNVFATGLNPTFLAFNPVAPIATAIRPQFTPSLAVYGQSATLTVQVAALAASVSVPSGPLSLVDGITPLGSVTLTNGQAVFQLAGFEPGNHSFHLAYGGDLYFVGSATTTNWLVRAADTVNQLTVDPSPAVFGQPVTLSSALQIVAPGAGTIDGTVTFYDGGSPLGSGTVTNGSVALTLASLAPGGHALWAAYNGSLHFNSSLSVTQNLTINPANTVIVGAVNPNPTNFGGNVHLAGQISVVAPGAGTPTGTISFLDDSNLLALVTVTNGRADIDVANLSAGWHAIQIFYSGDDNFYGFTISTNVLINPAPTGTGLGTSVNPSVVGQTVTLTANISVPAPGYGTPAGVVNFYDGATALGSANLTNGSATFDLNTLTLGQHLLTAVYAGAGNYSNSVSTVLTQVVSQAASSTVAGASPNPTVYGQPVTFSAVVSAVSPASGVPTGNVSFMEGTNNWGNITLTNGSASLTLSTLVAGSHSFSLNYGGDTNYQASSDSVIQVVN